MTATPARVRESPAGRIGSQAARGQEKIGDLKGVVGFPMGQTAIVGAPVLGYGLGP